MAVRAKGCVRDGGTVETESLSHGLRRASSPLGGEGFGGGEGIPQSRAAPVPAPFNKGASPLSQLR